MRSKRFSPTAFRRIAAVTLLSLCVIVVVGAGVRLTGSGLGCSTWPNCEPGSFSPREASDSAAWIEFLNRLANGVVMLAVLLTVIASRRRSVVRRDLNRWSYGLVAGVLGNALLGGVVVVFELEPKFVAAHYLLSAVTIFCATVLYRRAGEPDGSTRRLQVEPQVRMAINAVTVLAAAVLVAGTVVTGSGPHAGDHVAARLPFSVPEVARVHSVLAWFLVAALLAALWLGRDGAAAPEPMRALQRLFFAVMFQGIVGYIQYFQGVPVELVGLHVLGSVVVWWGAVQAWVSTEHAIVPTPTPETPARDRAAAS